MFSKVNTPTFNKKLSFLRSQLAFESLLNGGSHHDDLEQMAITYTKKEVFLAYNPTDQSISLYYPPS